MEPWIGTEQHGTIVPAGVVRGEPPAHPSDPRSGMMDSIMDRMNARARRPTARATDVAEPPIVATPDQRFLSLIRLIPAIVWEADGDNHRMTFVSDRCRDILGYDPEPWIAEKGFWEAHLHPEDRESAIAASELALQGVEEARIEYRFRAADGSYKWFYDVIQVLLDPDGRRRLVGVMVDVTERKTLERRLAHAAAHDALTGLRNRADLLASSQAVLGDPQKAPVALLFFDLDRFKVHNDRLGHAAGDEILRVVARRLERTVRPADIVGRLGGDEFLVVATRATPAWVRRQAARLRRRISEPINIDGNMVTLKASVGIAFAEQGESIDELVNRADQAMYRAKARHRAASAP